MITDCSTKRTNRISGKVATGQFHGFKVFARNFEHSKNRTNLESLRDVLGILDTEIVNIAQLEFLREKILYENVERARLDYFVRAVHDSAQ